MDRSCSRHVRRGWRQRRAGQHGSRGDDEEGWLRRRHAIDKKVIGPAYQEVAAKYKGDKDAATKLVDKVKKGGVGVWGQIPMPPNAQVPDADIKELVAWMLTLKK